MHHGCPVLVYVQQAGGRGFGGGFLNFLVFLVFKSRGKAPQGSTSTFVSLSNNDNLVENFLITKSSVFTARAWQDFGWEGVS